jgi:AraC-like DNA-binding protein
MRRTGSNRLGDISVHYVSVMARTLEQQGIDSSRWLSRFRVSRNLLTTPDARISIPRFMRMGHAAIQLTGDPALGLAFGENTRLTDLGIPGIAGACAPTLGESLGTLIAFERLTSYNSRGQSSTDRGTGGSMIASFYSISPYNSYNCFVVDAILSGWVQFLRHLSPDPVAPVAVDIEYAAPVDPAAYAEWFGCPVNFGAPANRIDLPDSITDLPGNLAQPALFRHTRAQCEAALQQYQWGRTTAQRVKEEIAPLMRGMAPEMAQIALRLGTTEWGLRRALTREDTRYRDLLDSVRSELASDYVRETPLSFTDIADLLGFANPSAFQKAFRRWYGCSPGDYRRLGGAVA